MPGTATAAQRAESAAEGVDDLYRVHAVGLVRFALLLVGDRATAEDVVQDAFRSGRALYRITEPLITFYEAIMRPRWGDLEQGDGSVVWADSRQRFSSAVTGPHFESVCRDFAATRGRELFGRPVGRVAAGAIGQFGPEPA